MGVFNWIARVFGPTNYGPMAVSNEIIPDALIENFKYPVGSAKGNATRNRSINDAALPMTQDEYNALLNKYNGLTSVPKETRREMGLQAIKENPKWVPGQNNEPKEPGGNKLGASSSVVRSIEINPQNQILIRFGNNPTQYKFNGGSTLQEAAQSVLDLINSPSIGRAVNSRLPGSWGRRHFDQSEGKLPDLASNMNAPSIPNRGTTGYRRNK